MNISKINNIPTQSFTGKYTNTTKKTVCALATAAAVFAATQKSNAQQLEFPPIQPGAIPTEDWYSMHERQRATYGVVSYIDPFGQAYVNEPDYIELQIKYEELMKNIPKESAFSKSVKQLRQQNTKKISLPISAERAKNIAEEEHKTTHNIITIGGFILGLLFGPGLIRQIIRKVAK